MRTVAEDGLHFDAIVHVHHPPRFGHRRLHRIEFDFDELTEAVGEDFDQNAFEEIMSTHYGRMVALDDRMILFADPEDAAEYLGFDLKPVSA